MARCEGGRVHVGIIHVTLVHPDHERANDKEHEESDDRGDKLIPERRWAVQLHFCFVHPF